MIRERTLCIFKPDLTGRHADVAHALIRIVAIDLLPVALRRDVITMGQARELYRTHVGAPYFDRNVEFMTSGMSTMIVLEGERACARMRELIGATDPTKAARGTLRAMFGRELPRNAVHASASPVDARDEILLFFGGVM
jgi:nucleoside-diphosphate kinase